MGSYELSCLLATAVGTAGIFSALTTGTIQWRLNRINDAKRLELDTAEHNGIDPAIQAEIDQTPEWWVSQFHALEQGQNK